MVIANISHIVDTEPTRKTYKLQRILFKVRRRRTKSPTSIFEACDLLACVLAVLFRPCNGDQDEIRNIPSPAEKTVNLLNHIFSESW